jgi:hypothetical protein
MQYSPRSVPSVIYCSTRLRHTSDTFFLLHSIMHKYCNSIMHDERTTSCYAIVAIVLGSRSHARTCCNAAMTATLGITSIKLHKRGGDGYQHNSEWSAVKLINTRNL